MKDLNSITRELQESKGREDGMNKGIKVMLVDDHELVRYGLRRMLEQEEDIKVVGDCADAEEAFSKVAVLKPDIVLMDSHMPGMNGIEATYHLKKNGLHYDGHVIVLAESVNDRSRALRAGADSYLLKDITHTELVRAIREVCSDKQSQKDRNLFVEETVELAVPPAANAAQILRFIYYLEERLTDNAEHNYASIVQMAGSWDRGTVIILVVRGTQFANLPKRLEDMPEVERIEEEPLAKGVRSGLPHEFLVLSMPGHQPE